MSKAPQSQKMRDRVSKAFPEKTLELSLSAMIRVLLLGKHKGVAGKGSSIPIIYLTKTIILITANIYLLFGLEKLL